ncbi:uncharacterized protein UDID_12265 [Ustilago sp. UG-2017a]|nr:uncharacterized protein UDID_12265 [Ustilago sp. UG-2017a]
MPAARSSHHIPPPLHVLQTATDRPHPTPLTPPIIFTFDAAPSPLAANLRLLTLHTFPGMHLEHILHRTHLSHASNPTLHSTLPPPQINSKSATFNLKPPPTASSQRKTISNACITQRKSLEQRKSKITGFSVKPKRPTQHAKREKLEPLAASWI